jgi:hypothetical protein
MKFLQHLAMDEKKSKVDDTSEKIRAETYQGL